MESPDARAILAAKDYAKNRIDLKAVNEEISALQIDSNGEYVEIDLSLKRTWWIEDLNHAWAGWVAALGGWDEEFAEIEMKLAVLLDRKKAIKNDAGKIKARIYYSGLAMIKESKAEQAEKELVG